MTPVNPIITGTTGMVGRSVLDECLRSAHVEKVLIINRSSVGLTHPKLTEILHKDFTDFSPVKSQLAGYNACFHCMGVSSIGMDESTYEKLTYDATESLVKNMLAVNPESVCTYVSGEGTDETERSSTHWRRIKGKTENMILNAGFSAAYMFRLGALIPSPGIKSKTGWVNFLYTVMRPVVPLLAKVMTLTSSEAIGKAMINLVRFPQEKKYLGNGEMNRVAKLD